MSGGYFWHSAGVCFRRKSSQNCPPAFLPKEFLGVFCPIIINCADLPMDSESGVASLSLHKRFMVCCDSAGLAECQNSIHH